MVHELKKWISISSKKNKKENNILIGYVGTLGHSYDIRVVIDALAIIQKQGIKNYKFIIIGDGPLKNEFQKHAQDKKVNCEFIGRLPYGEMMAVLGTCDIAVNPISKGAAQSIINKHADYAASGLPIINTQENLEYRNLIERYECGINCNNNDVYSLTVALEYLISTPKARYEMGKGSRKMAEELFDREVTYKKIEKIVINNGK